MIVLFLLDNNQMHRFKFFLTDFGITIFFSELHILKTKVPISVKEFGIITFSNDEQSLNVKFSYFIH